MNRSLSLISTCCLLSLFANPENGIVIEGNASFERGLSELVIRTEDRSIIHWDSFSIDAHEVTRFIQGGADAAVLNRVTGDQMSELMGTLIADGKVFLINPNGIIVGKDGVIDAASFIASSLDISDTAFKNGEEFLFEGSTLKPVADEGIIRAENGDILIMARRVDNQGTIDGKKIWVGVQGKKSLYVEIAGEGNIEALSKGHPYALGVQNGGKADALLTEEKGGQIYLRSALIDPNPEKEPLLWNAVASLNQENSFYSSLQDIRIIQVASCPPTDVELVDSNPTGMSSSFGDIMLPLPNGNVVVTKSDDSFGFSGTGAVYLYNSSTGALISTLRGSQMNDNVGNGGVVALTNGNYVVSSPSWANGGASAAGAATFGDGSTGVGVLANVSAANSLVGTTAGDNVSSGSASPGILALPNGNYVVSSPGWSGSMGAATFGNGVTGVSGVVSSANSLVGSQSGDFVSDQGSIGITALTNSNYVVSSPNWMSNGGGFAGFGAATWGDGSVGVSGVVSGANSLVGTQIGDLVAFNGITPLTNGHFVVMSPLWGNGTAGFAGAGTWGNGTTGKDTNGAFGAVTAANSLVGSQANDIAVIGIIPLTNGNYVAQSPFWANDTFGSAGAATWGDGTTGSTVGFITPANSLVGTQSNDNVASGVEALHNGHFVLGSPNWANGPSMSFSSCGAVTWGNGTTGKDINDAFGAVSTTNSLVGTNQSDQVGSTIFPLSNGSSNYVVASLNWKNGASTDAGAATWVNGTTGLPVGDVTPANSLVGTQPFDFVSQNGVTLLTNGNYVVGSGRWKNVATGALSAGAATWGNGMTGIVGIVSEANSLVGTQANDDVSADSGGSGAVVALANGNYVVQSPNWKNVQFGAGIAGAVTWGNGANGQDTNGAFGPVTPSNSLVGTQSGDEIGNVKILALSNGNYVVTSTFWANGAATQAGAATWGDGSTGLPVGPVGPANSIIGTQTNDAIANGGVQEFSSTSFVVISPAWWNGAANNTGAITVGSSTDGTLCDGTFGAVSALNSFIGSDVNDGLSNHAIVTGGESPYNFLVQFTNDPGQTKIFSILGVPISPSPSPSPSISSLTPVAKGVHNFAIAMTEFFNQPGLGWLSMRDVLDSSDIYPPLGTYKGVQQMYPTLVEE